ncbi:hypothetical protein A2U01_0063156, partial [Trifolium medium]|nr:hypothetical protein [Trifolium medium]
MLQDLLPRTKEVSPSSQLNEIHTEMTHPQKSHRHDSLPSSRSVCLIQRELNFAAASVEREVASVEPNLQVL